MDRMLLCLRLSVWALVLAAALTGLIYLASAWQAYRVKYFYGETTGTAVAKRIRDELIVPPARPIGRSGRPLAQELPRHVYHPEVQMTYVVDGASHTQWLEVGANRPRDERQATRALAAYVETTRHPVYYDPAQPDSASLFRGDGGAGQLTAGAITILILGAVAAILAMFRRAVQRGAPAGP